KKIVRKRGPRGCVKVRVNDDIAISRTPCLTPPIFLREAMNAVSARTTAAIGKANALPLRKESSGIERSRKSAGKAALRPSLSKKIQRQSKVTRSNTDW